MQRLDGGDGFAGVLPVDEHLLRHGVFQGRGQQTLELVARPFFLVVCVLPDDVKCRHVHRHVAGRDRPWETEEVADAQFVVAWIPFLQKNNLIPFLRSNALYSLEYRV
ncbi:MAG: hypothetical protein PHR16_15635 [Methylovulum sp.]|nr:hypothetical protein [Methylovulum sp.]